jgi:hypothetical protein
VQAPPTSTAFSVRPTVAVLAPRVVAPTAFRQPPPMFVMRMILCAAPASNSSESEEVPSGRPYFLMLSAACSGEVRVRSASWHQPWRSDQVLVLTESGMATDIRGGNREMREGSKCALVVQSRLGVCSGGCLTAV